MKSMPKALKALFIISAAIIAVMLVDLVTLLTGDAAGPELEQRIAENIQAILFVIVLNLIAGLIAWRFHK